MSGSLCLVITVVFYTGWLGLTGCSQASGPGPDNTRKNDMTAPHSSSGDSIVTTLDGLCDWLSEARRPARAVAEKLGTVESEGGSAIHVKPAQTGFSRIIVSREPDSEFASYVELALATPGAVTVAALTARFGQYTEPPLLHPDSPTAIHFAVDRSTERPLTCLVVAKLDEGRAGVSDGTVKELGIRIDPR